MVKILKTVTKAYLKAYRGLYGDNSRVVRGTSGIVKNNACNAVKKENKTKSYPTELQEQIKLCIWLNNKQILYYAIPNGGSRHFLEAINLKRSGVQRGVPDICIPVPSNGYHGLYIELKRIKCSRVTEEQKQWGDLLLKNKYQWYICFGCEEAQKKIMEYLGIDYFISY